MCNETATAWNMCHEKIRHRSKNKKDQKQYKSLEWNRYIIYFLKLDLDLKSYCIDYQYCDH